ncbi:MAG: hypothetical protein KC517_09365 [Bacteroidetes bacterium]|nr:hypothetical protein [Bacteroidota bacterium]
MHPKTITIDRTEYVRKDSVITEEVVFTGKETVASRMIGKAVIVRSRSEGINAGIVVVADETGVELKESRRLYHHAPKNKNMSWYEGVAISGIDDNSKVSPTTTKAIIENYSMTLMCDSAYRTIMEATPNAQN